MNKIITTIVVSYLFVHLTKFAILSYQKKELSWSNWYKTGGMPSAHSAAVVSLTTIIFLLEGLSTAFTVSLVFGFLVIRDSIGVRQSVGDHGELLYKLAKKAKIKAKFHHNKGHTLLQAIIGSVIGFLIAVVVYVV